MKNSYNTHAHHGTNMKKAAAKHALRCLLGCNVGEGTGAAIGFLLGFDIITTLALAVSLAFAFGYAFTIIPMLRTMSFRQAAKVALVGDTLSITAMEIVENSLVFLIPGFMMASMLDSIFWIGLGIILPAGFLAAYPSMYWTMKREMSKNNQMMKQMHHH